VVGGDPGHDGFVVDLAGRPGFGRPMEDAAGSHARYPQPEFGHDLFEVVVLKYDFLILKIVF
jgi:hypothetical protein